ncbi:MAG: NADH-quinone oxidoreductase subunit D [Schwartzia sp.]|nr:NADH-quinone oxidoreductase subunit D [Schwartzia sp. (in: firmicutes)]
MNEFNDNVAPKTETFVLNMGPQHPSTHGVLRVELDLDGEKVIRVRPIMGYLHRGIEKLLESRTYAQGSPFTDRLDYVSSMNNNYGYCHAVEELCGIEPPPRANYIRAIVAELNRITSHMVFIGSLANDLGAVTGMIYTFRDREEVLDIFDLVCGARQTYNYIRIGGVAQDIPQGFEEKVRKFLDRVPEFMEEYADLLNGNEIFNVRLKEVSVMTKEEALACNMTGPNLRATGVPFDVRKVDGYGAYPEFDFDVPVGENGDNWDRYQVRYKEILESAKIVRQALDGMPEGDFMAKVPKVLKPPKGEIFSRTEGTRGELGFYIVSDGTTKPYRVHIRRPSFISMQGLNPMCRGGLIGDAIAAFASIDPLMGEVDC